MNKQNSIEIYQTADGQTQVDVRFKQDSVWLNRNHLAELFGRDIKTITRSHAPAWECIRNLAHG